jgi:hypothetical protein
VRAATRSAAAAVSSNSASPVTTPAPARPLTTVGQTGSQFAREQRAGGTLTDLLTVSHQDALLRARAQIVALRKRLAAIRAPATARQLRSLLLQIIDGQARLTRELAQLVVFLPRYNVAVRPLTPATLRLSAALSRRTASGPAAVGAVYASKAAALRRFQAEVNAILSQLHKLRPPPVSKPDYSGQVSSLNGMSSTAGQLADALAGGPEGNVQGLLVKFDRAATGNRTVAAQKARIAAIRAYDGEIQKLATLSQAAERERLRLANQLK